MSTLIEFRLENEMDVMLAHQKMMYAAGLLKLSITTKTTFVTAISELSRVLIEHTDNGHLKVALQKEGLRFKLTCLISYPLAEGLIDEDLFFYAKKLVPNLDITSGGELHQIGFAIGLPKSVFLDAQRLIYLEAQLRDVAVSPYEEIKIKNSELSRKAIEQEQQLQYSKQLADLKNEFLAVASHEIKTPLTVLHAYVQLASRMQSIDQMKDLIVKVEQQLKKLTSLSVKLLDSAKIDNGKLEYNKTLVKINPYLEKVIDDLRFILPGHELKVILGENVYLNIDELRIEQVIGNILSNAAKYSSTGSRIHFTSRLNDANSLVISVEDTGLGMRPESLDMVFNKFYRDQDLSPTYAGLGMGMYISAQIIREHGGEIWAESELGKGSTFFFSLPIAAM